jgi:hypothetical protein
MPYIKPEFRVKYDDILNRLPTIETKGDLEYIIFKVMKQFMSTRESRYSTLHECTYCATHCADEFRRRYLDSRENDARIENGDVE